MPLYNFECEGCNITTVESGSMTHPPKPGPCPCCGKKMLRIWDSRVDTFKPFVDIHTTGKPERIETRAQREAFCERHNVTYDTGRYVRRPIYKPVMDQVTYEDVRREIETNGPATPFTGDAGEIPSRDLN